MVICSAMVTGIVFPTSVVFIYRKVLESYTQYRQWECQIGHQVVRFFDQQLWARHAIFSQVGKIHHHRITECIRGSQTLLFHLSLHNAFHGRPQNLETSHGLAQVKPPPRRAPGKAIPLRPAPAAIEPEAPPESTRSTPQKVPQPAPKVRSTAAAPGTISAALDPPGSDSDSSNDAPEAPPEEPKKPKVSLRKPLTKKPSKVESKTVEASNKEKKVTIAAEETKTTILGLNGKCKMAEVAMAEIPIPFHACVMHGFWKRRPSRNQQEIPYVWCAFCSPHLCVGFLFLVACLPLLLPPPPASSSPSPTHSLLTHNSLTQLVHTQLTHTQLTHTHNVLTHNLLTHNLFTHNLFTHNLLTHNLFAHNLNLLTQLTHNLLTHNLLTHNLFTHNLLTHSHTTYSHTQFTHTQQKKLPHTQFAHTHTHNSLTHSLAWQAWHLVTSTFTLCGAWWHPPSLYVAGMALGDIHRHFAWQAWHVWHWVGSGGALGSRLAPLSPRLFVWQAWHLATWTSTLHGRRGTWRHQSAFCVSCMLKQLANKAGVKQEVQRNPRYDWSESALYFQNIFAETFYFPLVLQCWHQPCSKTNQFSICCCGNGIRFSSPKTYCISLEICISCAIWTRRNWETLFLK